MEEAVSLDDNVCVNEASEDVTVTADGGNAAADEFSSKESDKRFRITIRTSLVVWAGYEFTYLENMYMYVRYSQ